MIYIFCIKFINKVIFSWNISMHSTVKNLLDIKNNIKVNLDELNIKNYPKIIAVSKTFKIDQISPLIDYEHLWEENKI